MPTLDLDEPTESTDNTPVLEAMPMEEEPPAAPPAPASPEPTLEVSEFEMEMGADVAPPPAAPIAAAVSEEAPTFDVANLGAEVEPEPSAPPLAASMEPPSLELRPVQVGPDLQADTIELTEDAVEPSEPTFSASGASASVETGSFASQSSETQAFGAADVDLSGSPDARAGGNGVAGSACPAPRFVRERADGLRRGDGHSHVGLLIKGSSAWRRGRAGRCRIRSRASRCRPSLRG